MPSIRKPKPALQWGLLLLALLTSVVRADIYVYKEKDGTTWYTNRQLPKNQFTLLATIGRPSASSSCRGVTSAILEQRASIQLPVIRQYATHYGVDANLIKALISVESCFDRYAVSRVGAKGLMQLMPATAKRMGVYNVFNPKDNIRGGIRYFARMMARFGQNTDLALAAYNAGPRAVEKYGGIPPYRETQKYVKRVLTRYERFAAATP